MPTMADTLVTFRHKETGEEIGPVLVSLVPLSLDMILRSPELKNPLLCTWDEPLRFPRADRPIRAGDLLVCERLNSGASPVHQPMTFLQPGYCSRAIVEDVQG